MRTRLLLLALSCLWLNSATAQLTAGGRATQYAGFPLDEDKRSECLTGDCKNGPGLYFKNHGFLSIEIEDGTYRDGYLMNGAIYNYNSYGYGRQLRIDKIRQGTFVSNLLAEGTYYELSYATGDTLLVATGTFTDEYFKPIVLKKGVKMYYPRGKAGGQWLREEGTFTDSGYAVTVTCHNLLTVPDGQLKLTSPYNQCLDGNCKNGRGVALTEYAVIAGKFKDDRLIKGTCEFYHPYIRGGFGVFSTQDGGATGKFSPGGDEDEMDATLPNAADLRIDSRYYSLAGYQANAPTPYSTAWLQDVYLPHSYMMMRVKDELAAYDQAKAAEYARQHPSPPQGPSKPYSKETDPFYYSPAEREQMRQIGTDGRSTCSYCNGSGSVGTGKTYMGREIPARCPYCYGTGRR